MCSTFRKLHEPTLHFNRVGSSLIHANVNGSLGKSLISMLRKDMRKIDSKVYLEPVGLVEFEVRLQSLPK